MVNAWISQNTCFFRKGALWGQGSGKTNFKTTSGLCPHLPAFVSPHRPSTWDGLIKRTRESTIRRSTLRHSRTPSEFIKCFRADYSSVQYNVRRDELVSFPSNSLSKARAVFKKMLTVRAKLKIIGLYPSVATSLRSQWQRKWDDHSINKLKEVKLVLGPWSSSSRRSRREEVVLSILRIGHCYATHSYLLRGEDRPNCPYCDVSLTVAHVLLACPRHRASRSRFLRLPEPIVTLRHLLGDDSA